MARWQDRAEVPAKQILLWLGIPEGTFYKWRQRYGKVNEHNAWIPRDHWLNDWEKQAIIDFHFEHPLEGYRRLTYMMLDADIVAAAPSTVYRVLKRADLIGRAKGKPSKKGTGFHQPTAPHRHWHIDVSYVNIGGTFYYLISELDGYSRFIVHWEIRERSTDQDIQVVLQRARERFPGVTPRIISDNGPQFISREFKQYIRICGMTHVRTSPYYPQRIVTKFVEDYNERRLHSSLGYVTPRDKLLGREQDIFDARDRKLEEARELRKQQHRREAQNVEPCYTATT